MKPQEQPSSCGPAAARACLHLLGHTVSERSLRELAETGYKTGTHIYKLAEAIATFGYKAKISDFDLFSLAWLRLRVSLNNGYPAILMVNNNRHYVAALGMLGHNALIFDPASTKKYSNIKLFSREKCWEMWRYYNEESKQYNFSTIIIST